MARKNRADSQRTTPPTPAPPRDRLASVLKWVGAATAILTLIFGLHRLSEMITDRNQRRREVAELVASAELLQKAENYDGAWTTLGRAAELDGDSPEIRHAREDLAMEWLQNIRVTQGQRTFTDIVEQLTPVLARGATLEQEQRKADLLAHLGWADFLRSRDRAGGLRPEEHYRQALAADPENVYANAMLGHLILWRGGDLEGSCSRPVQECLEQANQHFRTALASGREREYVRHIQFAAYRVVSNEVTDLELIRMGSEMHQSREKVTPDLRTEIFRSYTRLLRNPCSGDAAGLPAAVAEPGISPDDQLVTFAWLFDHPEFPERDHADREYYHGCLLEGARRREEALRQYQSALSLLEPGRTLHPAVAVAIERLSRSAPE